MEIILRQNSDIIKQISFEKDIFDELVFGSDLVKEISFIHTIKNSDDLTLEDLYRELKLCEYKNSTSVSVVFSDGYYYNYNVPIKDIYHRILWYSCQKQEDTQETLTIRFQENTKAVLEEGIMHCADDCPHLKNNFCKLYGLPIEYGMVTKSCFFENISCIDNLLYEEMQKESINKWKTNIE